MISLDLTPSIPPPTPAHTSSVGSPPLSRSMSRIALKRLQKELAELQQKGPPAGCRLIQAENLEEWVIALQVLGESVYEGGEFARSLIY